MGKKKLFLVSFLGLAVLAGGCGAGGASMQDGYFTAVEADFDEYGWKEYVTIRVQGGRIIYVEYNAFNSSGFIKSWDMDYMRTMNAVDGTYPNEYSRYYERQFLEKQSADGIEALSGATESYTGFIALSGAVIKKALEGGAIAVGIKAGGQK